MGRKKDAMQAIAGGVTSLIKDQVNQMQATGEIPVSEDSEETLELESPPSPEVKKMLSSFPGSEGYYGKIYKTKPNGKWALMDFEIVAPETISDLELEVQSVVRDKGWGPGEYRVHVRNRRKPGVYLNEAVIIGDSSTQRTSEPHVNNLENIRNMVETVDAIRGPSNPEALSATILKAVETGRAMAPAPVPANGKDNTLALLLEIVPLIKDLFPRAPQSDVDTIVERVISRTQPKEDFFQSLLKYQEAMAKLNPSEKRRDALSSVNEVASIIQAIRPLTAGASGEPPSWGQVLIEHGAKLIEPIISTFKEWAEAKKMEMQLRIEQVHNPPLQAESGAVVQKRLPVVQVHPFAARIVKAINDNDESYFDMMRQQIIRLYGQHVIDGLIDGSLTSSFAMETLSEIGLPLNLENAKSYFDRFVKYLVGIEGQGVVLAECKSCHQQFDFPDMDAWKKDSKKCEDCAGDLELVKQGGEA